MGKIIRFGVSLDNALLKRFDALAEIKGYSSRSEAIRGLIRNKIVEEEWATDSNVESIGTINIVYDHHIKNLSNVLN
ncbi:MAG TPA: ribbon-helix-helix protein, CopG family, partial [Firmicutes bacterium]|nr:ribbon-helix-helix protein, CopG family [Bacillota bacterium]